MSLLSPQCSPTPDPIPSSRAGVPLVELSQATKVLDATVAIWRVDLQPHAGEGVGIVGATAPGRPPCSERSRGVLELDAGAREAAPSLKTALLGHRSGLFDDLTVLESLRLFDRR